MKDYNFFSDYQKKKGVNIDNNRTNSNLNENMDQLIPASKIASLNAGEIVGVVSKESTFEHKEFVPNVFNGKISLDINQIDKEKSHYRDLPRFYEFGIDEFGFLNNLYNVFDGNE